MSNIGPKTSRAARDRPELSPRRIQPSRHRRRSPDGGRRRHHVARGARPVRCRAKRDAHGVQQPPRASLPQAAHHRVSNSGDHAPNCSSIQRQTCATMREAAPHRRRTKRGKRAVIARIIAQPIARDGGQRSDSELRIHARSCGIQQAITRPGASIARPHARNRA
ncbi:hypothetical protein F511_44715 [Dorcoceras hygrometricum]|uniref:Uncharacterized protein n=1 Tax=Dorcoceras hygrometricum TaxID=472368 RepID=A0A2Z7AWI9_9LAMI|nr:hypothetical protein F511_44715 [Dorcoceras hygrometricum]